MKKKVYNREQALSYVLRLLQQRSYSEHALRQKLILHQVNEVDTASIITQLKEAKLIDDKRYTTSLIRSEAVWRNASPQRIRQKLYQKGVARDLIESGMQEPLDIPNEFERALHHANRFIKKKHPPDEPLAATLQEPAFRNNLFAYLYRRGFNGSAINQVWQEIKGKNF